MYFKMEPDRTLTVKAREKVDIFMYLVLFKHDLLHAFEIVQNCNKDFSKLKNKRKWHLLQ